MDVLKYKEYEPIYFIGHSKIDIDSVIGSSLMASIFNYFGVKAYYCVLDKNYEMDLYNKNMVNECIDYNPVIIKENDVPKYNFALVDHNDPTQSIKNKSRVLFCVDHHIDSNIIEEKYISSHCCVSLYIYEMFKDVYPFSEKEKYQIYMAFLKDSTFTKSSRYREEDGKVISTFGFSSNYEELFYKYFVPTDLSSGIDLMSSLKTYNFDGVSFRCGGIKALDTKLLLEYEKLIKNEENYLGIWWDYKNNKTYCYFMYDGVKKDFFYDYIASRATTIIGDVLKYLKENNYL